MAKTTINNWLTLAGLTLSADHLKIQIAKRKENHIIATEASRITRRRKRESEIDSFVQELKTNFNDPLFVAGIMLYEAEGSKGDSTRFSNSDYRLIKVFLKFIKKCLKEHGEPDLSFRLAIHESRKGDLRRILSFWSKKLFVPIEKFKITWKKNIVTHRKENRDYVGQMEVSVKKAPFLTGKLLAVSDIILSQHLRTP